RGPTVSVAPAIEIIGKRVIGAQDSDAGRVNSVIVDTSDGKIDYLVVSGAGSFDLNGQVVAVPWSAIDEVDA
ncbi:MAG: PRC-barrel domain-containing protein, partial [Hyphomicrobiales bacterium]|nr:PRC-barrel domain-containing protein [Hyphomicrobiales bacterium]